MTAPMEGHYADQLRRVIAGERWLLGWDVLVGAGFFANRIQALGGECMAIGASRGAGDLPDGLRTLALDVRAADMMGGIRAAEAAIDALPPEAVAAVDAWDPERRARAVRPLFSAGAPVAGRPTWGARPAAWRALEDKTTVDALWDAAGIPRAPAQIVPAAPAALADAHRALDRGLGTVWAGDNKSGWHGGASYLRWVRDLERDGPEAAAFLGAACDRVRVMPFLDGIPCSVHGISFPDQTIALRPCEMLVFRQPGSNKLRYSAAATFWDPPAADREAMRSVARRVGDHLRATLGYRGVFTVDGVMTAEAGFLPTELNPRFGAAIGVMTRGIPGLPMYLLHLALVAGEDLDWRPGALEAQILAHADAQRDGRAGLISPVPRTESIRSGLVFEDRGGRVVAREVREGEEPDATLFMGPATSGSYVGGNLLPDRTPIGPSPGPRVAALYAWTDANWGTQIGPLEPASNLRR